MTVPPPPTLPNQIGFGTLTRGLKRYSLLLLLFVLLAAGAGAAVWVYLPPPNNTGYVLFRISIQPHSVLQPTQDAMMDFNTYRSLQMATLKSKQITVPVASDPQVAALGTLDRSRVADPVTWLGNNLRVDFPQGGEFMRVSLDGDNKDDLLAIVKVVKDVYLRETVNKDKASRAARIENLNSLHQKYVEELKSFQTSIRNARLRLQSGDPLTLAMRERFLEAQIGSAQGRLNDVINSNREHNVGLSIAKSETTEPNRIVIPDELLTELARHEPDFNELAKRKATLETFYKESAKLALENTETPRMREIKTQTAELDKQMADLVVKKKPEIAGRYREKVVSDDRQRLASFEQKMKLNEEYRKVLELDLVKLINDRKEMNSGQIDLEGLRESIVHTQAVADRIQAEVQKLRPEMDAPTRVALWEEPVVVNGVEGNRRTKYTAMAAGGCVLLGLVLVTWLEHRNRRIQGTDEVTRGMGLRVIGTVPIVPREAFKNSTNNEWHYHLTESVDATRTMLIYGSQSARRILVTSAVSGEGKTSLTTHLAASLARTGLRVLLLDADMRRPAVHRVFGLSVKPGLAEVLTGRANLADVKQSCRVPGLHIVPGGAWAAEAGAALSTPLWDDLIREADPDYDFILIDSPPILPVADALSIARKVDGVIVAVMRDVSRFAAVEMAHHKLSMVGANILGVVVSGMAPASYYYYDRYYTKPGEAAAASKA